MEAAARVRGKADDVFHFKRIRINDLFKEAVKYPLVVVCAGSGYGKTSAVRDFAEENQIPTTWIHLSERDNVGTRFWENCANTIANINAPFAKAAVKLGFPDTSDKLKQYSALMQAHVKVKQRILVFDDFQFIKEPSVIRFLEECILHRMPPGTSIFMLSRSSPHINIAGLVSKGYIFNINENDLRFTENELARYFHQFDASGCQNSLREIMHDTRGWAFAINLIAHSVQKAPGYSGYVRSAMKINIFRLMETGIWDGLSKRMQNFLVRLSLIEHLSVDLITLLAEDDKSLISGLEKLNAYVRYDSYINAFLIHPLFLEFLAAKQESICEKQKNKTYSTAGKWCRENGFVIDALSYFEKTGDYDSIVSILNSLPPQIPRDIANYAVKILDRAPEQAVMTVNQLATMHLSAYMCQGLWEKSLHLAEHYEKIFLKLQGNDSFRNQALNALYYCWGYLRALMCLTDGQYDFDLYFEKSCKCFTPPLNLSKLYNHCPGPWIISAGSSKKGEPEKFIESLRRSNQFLTSYFNGFKTGEDELAVGELKFYQGDLHSAEIHIIRALEQAREYRQFEVIHRSLFYILRLSIAQGNYQKAQKTLKEIKADLDEEEYFNRYTNYDITLSWYYCILGSPEKTPDWLTSGFSQYGHAAFIENFANQMKALYFYTTRDFPPILSYINELKQRESYLFGRTEMLAMEACIHYKMKSRDKALNTLREAYETASPNSLIMPFVELGKDMRTLSVFAAKNGCGIPKSWLETVNRKSASYAKRLAHVTTEYRQANSITDIVISTRETEILTDLSHGLSRMEIAVNRNLSINTVKMVINNVYMKLGAENLADAIRIAVERKIL